MSSKCQDCDAKIADEESRCPECTARARRLKSDTVRDRLTDRPASDDIPVPEPSLLRTPPPSPPAGGNGRRVALLLGVLLVLGALGAIAAMNSSSSSSGETESSASRAAVEAREAAEAADERARRAEERAADAEDAAEELKQQRERDAREAREARQDRKDAEKRAADERAAVAARIAAQADDCPGFDLGGVDYGPGAGYFDISVRGMECQEAKNLIMAAGSDANFIGLEAHGWTCQDLGADGETNQYRCEDSRQRAFRWWFGA